MKDWAFVPWSWGPRRRGRQRRGRSILPKGTALRSALWPRRRSFWRLSPLWLEWVQERGKPGVFGFELVHDLGQMSCLLGGTLLLDVMLLLLVLQLLHLSSLVP